MVDKKQYLKSNQEGVVSIIVTIILILIMTLIVLAMSQNANREQRQALDRQLSDQAYYNAESGINDTADYLYRSLNDPTVPLDNQTSCNDPFTTATTPDKPVRTIGAAGTNNTYTCVLYDKAPKTIQIDPVPISTPKVVPILPFNQLGDTAVDLSTLTISWDDSADRSANIGNCDGPKLPPDCEHGGVRFELIRIGNNRDEMRASTVSGFLLPKIDATSTITIGATGDPNNQGILKSAACEATATGNRRCTATITGLSGKNFYLSLRSLYRPTNVSISGTSGASDVRFKDAQIMIDVTGKAADVLRRVKVRLPAKSQYDYPGFALQTKESICKTLQVSLSFAGVGSVDSTDVANCPASPAP